MSESTLHQISPYIGKMKSSMAGSLISTFTERNQTIYDPFCGSGTVAFEAWLAGRNVIATDLSPYAFVLTRAKLFPPYSISSVERHLEKYDTQVQRVKKKVDLRKVPTWVREFFHPETLREALCWANLLQQEKSYFLLSCLLGILHHQRPGFLSYPSSHTTPYLRRKNFPPVEYPELYEYRSVRDRLEKKATRAMKRVTDLDRSFRRQCVMRDASTFVPSRTVDAIITSPPYMRQLDYGRDNRLRLWFLGLTDWNDLDRSISPSEETFMQLFKSCLAGWVDILSADGVCVLVVGDAWSKLYKATLPSAIVRMATKEIGSYSLVWKHTEAIPSNRRVRRGYCGSETETVLVLRNKLK